MYQIVRQMLKRKELFGLTPKVTFGEVLSSMNHQQVLKEIEHSARRTFVQHVSGFQDRPSYSGSADLTWAAASALIDSDSK